MMRVTRPLPIKPSDFSIMILLLIDLAVYAFVTGYKYRPNHSDPIRPHMEKFFYCDFLASGGSYPYL